MIDPDSEAAELGSAAAVEAEAAAGVDPPFDIRRVQKRLLREGQLALQGVVQQYDESVQARSRQMALQGRTLAEVVEHRYRALRAPARRGPAEERHRAWLERSPSYRELCEETSEPETPDLDSTTIAGMTWRVPHDARKPGGLADRFATHAWLPLMEILATRELAVGTAMIDIGANIGGTSVTRVVLGDFQYVYAAEPESANYTCLIANVVRNGLQGFVLPDRVALGATDGWATMRVAAHSIGSHRLREERASGAASSDPVESLPGEIQVPLRRLDSWVREMAIDVDLVSFIKCDTQGWETHVLAGAGDVLSRKHIAWEIEVWPAGLAMAGSSIPQLYDLIRAHFTHFIDLRGLTFGERVRRTSELETALAPLAAVSKKSFTELLLFNGAEGPLMPTKLRL